MTDETSNLGLPFLMPAQAQKHVTVNESLTRLDALVQLGVESRALAAEPGSPADGAAWILPPGKTGAQWDGFADDALAYYRDGAWEQLAPRPGWRAFVKDEGALLVWTGARWAALAPAAGGSGGFRNAIVNGCFRVWQRTTSFGDANGYTADRWHTNRAGGALGLQVSRQPGPPGQRYSLRAQRAAGNAGTEALNVHHTLETADAVLLQGQPLTLSLWARRGADFSAAGGLVGVQILTGTGTDQPVTGFTGSALLLDATIAPGAAWQRFSVTTPPVPTSATEVGVRLFATPAGTAGAADWWELAGLQLEPGVLATPFEHRHLAVEEAMCERFFQSLAFGVNGMVALGVSPDASSAFAAVRLKRSMRGVPAVALPSSGSGAAQMSFLAGTTFPSVVGSHTVNQITNFGFRVVASGYTGLPGGSGATILQVNSGASVITAQAEL